MINIEKVVDNLDNLLYWARRHRDAFDLAEYASDDIENTINKNYWEGQVDLLEDIVDILKGNNKEYIVEPYEDYYSKVEQYYADTTREEQDNE